MANVGARCSLTNLRAPHLSAKRMTTGRPGGGMWGANDGQRKSRPMANAE